MSFLNKLKDIGSMVLAPATGGLSLLGASEDTVARVPIVGGLMGAQSDAQKALIKKQEQMAAEAKAQQERNRQMRMQALGQSMLAFNPQNQMMAQMFGPQAAFSPQQFAQMAGDPGAKPLPDAEKAWIAAASAAPIDPNTRRRDGQPLPANIQQDLERARENERRKRAIEQQMTPLGPGPAPLRLPPPAAPRRY